MDGLVFVPRVSASGRNDDIFDHIFPKANCTPTLSIIVVRLDIENLSSVYEN